MLLLLRGWQHWPSLHCASQTMLWQLADEVGTSRQKSDFVAAVFAMLPQVLLLCMLLRMLLLRMLLLRGWQHWPSLPCALLRMPWQLANEVSAGIPCSNLVTAVATVHVQQVLGNCMPQNSACVNRSIIAISCLAPYRQCPGSWQTFKVSAERSCSDSHHDNLSLC